MSFHTPKQNINPEPKSSGFITSKSKKRSNSGMRELSLAFGVFVSCSMTSMTRSRYSAPKNPRSSADSSFPQVEGGRPNAPTSAAGPSPPAPHSKMRRPGSFLPPDRCRTSAQGAPAYCRILQPPQTPRNRSSSFSARS